MFDYSRWCIDDISHSMEFFDEILIELGENPLYRNRDFVSVILNQYSVIFDLDKKTAAPLTLYFDGDGIRIDINALPELIEYSLEDIQNDSEKVKHEIKDILTLEIRITNYSKRYFEIEILENDRLKRRYTHSFIFFPWLSLWRWKKEMDVFMPIFGQKQLPREGEGKVLIDKFDYSRWCHSGTVYHLEFLDKILMELGEEPLYENANVTSFSFMKQDAFFNIKTQNSALLNFDVMSDEIRIGLIHITELFVYSFEKIRQEPERVVNEIKTILTSEIHVTDYCKRRYKIKVIGKGEPIVKEVKWKKSWFARKECLPDVKKYAPVFDQ